MWGNQWGVVTCTFASGSGPPPTKKAKALPGKRKSAEDSDDEGGSKAPAYQATFAWDHYPFPAPAVRGWVWWLWRRGNFCLALVWRSIF